MIHIGKHIKKVLKDKGMGVTELARRINTNRNNVYDIFERESLDTALLQKISNILEHDFFAYFKQTGNKESHTFNEASVKYGKPDENLFTIEQLREKLENCRKESEYLKLLVKEKNKIISLMEKKK